jgi:hypothetical protein
MKRIVNCLIVLIIFVIPLKFGSAAKPDQVVFQAVNAAGRTAGVSNDALDERIDTYTQSSAVSGSLDQQIVYLPLVIYPHPSKGIYGVVTDDGDPLPDIMLELRFYNGATWSTIAADYTNINGEYSFLGMPGLNPGQYYYVLYVNDIHIQWLWTWHTASISNYFAGGEVNIGNFDLGEVYLETPERFRTVSVPVTFNWWERTASPGDSYAVRIYDPYFPNTNFLSAQLGYVYSYKLNSLPPGFRTCYWYGWEVWVYSSDGGFGISYDIHEIKFTDVLCPITTGGFEDMGIDIRVNEDNLIR